MTETFYSELGVESDADAEAIQRAYRNHVKATHPDVSDDPDATESFKRLTTARDVLLDERKRKRYDRLGHDAYVSHHARESVWNQTGSDQPPGGDSAAPGGPASRSSSSTTWSGASGRQTSQDRTSRSSSSRTDATRQDQSTTQSAQTSGQEAETARSRTDGGYKAPGWETASDVYSHTSVGVKTRSESTVRNTMAGMRELGAWFLVHVVLILSTMATAWFLFLSTPSTVTVPPTAVVATALLVPLVLTVSALHILVTLNS